MSQKSCQKNVKAKKVNCQLFWLKTSNNVNSEILKGFPFPALSVKIIKKTRY